MERQNIDNSPIGNKAENLANDISRLLLSDQATVAQQALTHLQDEYRQDVQGLSPKELMKFQDTVQSDLTKMANKTDGLLPSVTFKPTGLEAKVPLQQDPDTSRELYVPINPEHQPQITLTGDGNSQTGAKSGVNATPDGPNNPNRPHDSAATGTLDGRFNPPGTNRPNGLHDPSDSSSPMGGTPNDSPSPFSGGGARPKDSSTTLDGGSGGHI